MKFLATKTAITTNYKHTMSLSLDDGELFEQANTVLFVYSSKTRQYLGFITSEHFKTNKYTRRVRDTDTPVSVCRFVKGFYV